SMKSPSPSKGSTRSACNVDAVQRAGPIEAEGSDAMGFSRLFPRTANRANCQPSDLRTGQEPSVRVSAKADYACIAMVELASRYRAGQPVQIKNIAEAHNISPRFLVQILLQLKGAGLVASSR